MTSPDLPALARTFAGEVTELLNGTVCHGVRLTAVRRVATDHMVIAPGITDKNLDPKFVALCLGRGRPSGYLMVVITTQLDDESQYLTVNKSQFALYRREDRKSMLLHYDYNRDPANEYPAAHVQVNGMSKNLRLWCKARGVEATPLPRIHLPVGGRRFRPTLEDVIEFLVVEGLATPRDGWDKVVARHRRRWEELQLKAAIRRDLVTTTKALSDAGYVISAPPEPPASKTKRR